MFDRDVLVYISLFVQFAMYGALFLLVYFLVKVLIVKNIHTINCSLSEIAMGNLDVVVDVRNSREFNALSDDINHTVQVLKKHIDEADARIKQELKVAKFIQLSALPRTFPSYPNRTEFDLYARMDTAKEVGGDFYDFYLLDENKLAFLIADVSGKGIPAAMFMMTSKTLIKSAAEAGHSANEVFAIVNDKLCENNDAGMFVTAWIGILDLKTGMLEFANAGHNPPLIRRKGGKFEYLKTRAGFVLAGMEEVQFCRNELQLEPGDEIFLYTDGVTEAMDMRKWLYGEERLLEFVNMSEYEDAKTLCDLIKNDVDWFVGEAPQFDDITMLFLMFKGGAEQ